MSSKPPPTRSFARGAVRASAARIDHFALAVESRATLEAVQEQLSVAGAQEVGEIQRLVNEWSLFFRDPDGMELEVCCSADD